VGSTRYTQAGEFRREALSVSRLLGDESLIARSLNRVGNWHMNLEEPQTGLPHHEEALGIFERLGDGAGVAETVDLIAMAITWPASSAPPRRTTSARSRYSRSSMIVVGWPMRSRCSRYAAHRTTRHRLTPFSSVAGSEELRSPRSLRLAHEIGWRTGGTFSAILIADCLAWRGEYDRAIPLAHEALAEAKEIDHFEWTAGAFRLLGVLSLELLSPDAAREHLETAHRIAQLLGSHVWIRWTAAPLAWRALAHRTCRSGRRPGTCRASVGGGSPATPPVGADSRTLTLGERQLWLARAEVALAERKPELTLENRGGATRVGACGESRWCAGGPATLPAAR
jgi:tetratricopeptide (TPR) repeat protein